MRPWQSIRQGVLRRGAPAACMGSGAQTPVDSVRRLDTRPETGVRLSMVGSSSSRGVRRDDNEDSLLVLASAATAEKSLPSFGVYCVADGAGGNGQGAWASSTAVRAVARNLMVEVLSLPERVDSGVLTERLEVMMRKSFDLADEAVHQAAQGGVTTLTVAVQVGAQLTIGHVGDSRAYLFSEQGTELLTRDHSVAGWMVEMGQITPGQAFKDLRKNLLWNTVGNGARATVDITSRPVPRPGTLLLCSDGLWSELPEAKLRDIVTHAPDPQEGCERLIDAANRAGGTDNITAVLVRFPKG